MTKSETSSQNTIFGFPDHGISYTQSLYEAVRQRGVNVREGIWAGRWLLANTKKGDTLHLHWPSFLYYDQKSYPRSLVLLIRFVVLSLMSRMRGVRIVWTAHNLYPHDGGSSIWMHRFGRWFVVRIADCIYVHGRTAAKIVKSEFGLHDGALRIIPHGHWIGSYPNDINREDARERLGLSGSNHIFLFMGLCKPYKGLENLIDSVATLPQGTTLVIAGKFPSQEYQTKITALAERAGPSRVAVFPGFIADDQLQVFLNAADTVVLPYREILTSGVTMLAMSYGRPVVAPRLGSLIDVVNDRSGVLYEMDEPNGLAQALLQAQATEFDSAEIMQHVSTFTWDSAADTLIKEHQKQEANYRRSYRKTTYTALIATILLLGLQLLLLQVQFQTPIAQAALAIFWLIIVAGGIAFVSGLVVLFRDWRERMHLPDLFYHYVSRIPKSNTKGWRRLIRPFLGKTLRPGDIVCLRSLSEIQASLDESGKLDGLPFMSEMLAFQDRQWVVQRRIDKINDWINQNDLRRTKHIVTLVDVRCDGAAHGGCQAACQILWHERWLRRVSASQWTEMPVSAEQSIAVKLDQQLANAASQKIVETDPGKRRYMCQITELLHISKSMSRYDIRPLIRPLLNGNVPLTGWLVAMLTALFNRLQKLRHGVDYPLTAPQLDEGPTPIRQLNLQPGEVVRVRDKYEIGMTLHKNHNRGIWFGKELVRFCNKHYTVRSRVENIINERTGEMMTLKTPCVILESVCGSGEFLQFCPQNEYAFWREIWLERSNPI
jgi:beta-1,4-mannosyltransferase